MFEISVSIFMCMRPSDNDCRLDVTRDYCRNRCTCNSEFWEWSDSKNEKKVEYCIRRNGYHSGKHRHNRLTSFLNICSICLIDCKWQKSYQNDSEILKRLLHCKFNRCAFTFCQDTIELMKSEVSLHASGTEQSDDLTMLCLKINN